MPEPDNLQMWQYQQQPAESPGFCCIFEQHKSHRLLLIFLWLMEIFSQIGKEKVS